MHTFGSKISLGVACFFGLLNADILTDCNNDIYPSPTDVVICNNSCINCNIICNNAQKCQDIKVYSGAFNTNIYCLKYRACKDAEIYVMNNFDESNFKSTQNVTNVVCDAVQSCMDMNLVMEGYFNYGGSIKLMDYWQSFKGSELDININTNVGYGFFLECDTNQLKCYDVMYTCHNSNCECTGNCPDIVFQNASSFVMEYIFT